MTKSYHTLALGKNTSTPEPIPEYVVPREYLDEAIQEAAELREAVQALQTRIDWLNEWVEIAGGTGRN